MKIRVRVTLKPGLLDPQGQAIGNALGALGFGGIGEVRQGKVIEIEFLGTDRARIREQAEEMCKQLLANPVTEDYTIEIVTSG
jgi:phosphoribosylformylglycinamidine synthase subunit PurS